MEEEKEDRISVSSKSLYSSSLRSRRDGNETREERRTDLDLSPCLLSSDPVILSLSSSIYPTHPSTSSLRSSLLRFPTHLHNLTRSSTHQLSSDTAHTSLSSVPHPPSSLHVRPPRCCSHQSISSRVRPTDGSSLVVEGRRGLLALIRRRVGSEFVRVAVVVFVDGGTSRVGVVGRVGRLDVDVGGGRGGVGVALLSDERSGEGRRRDGCGRVLVRIVERRGKSVQMVLHGLRTEKVRMA